MIFFTHSENRSYQIEVLESPLKWQVRIQDSQTRKEEVHSIAKKDFRQFGELISFLFKHSSYLVDIVTRGDNYTVFTRGSLKTLKLLTEEKLLYNELAQGSSKEKENHIKSTMPGKIIGLKVKVGDKVKEGDLILVMEAMKMENEMRSVLNGVVKKVAVKKNQTVEADTVLVSIYPH